MTTAKTVTHRLYLTAFWMLTAFGALVATWVMVAAIHDGGLRERARACVLDWQRKSILAIGGEVGNAHAVGINRDAIELCGLNSFGYTDERFTSDIGDFSVKGAWYSGYLGPDGEHPLRPVAGFFAFIPLGLLVLTRRWIIWLTRPATSSPGAAPTL